ncbi:hypothetical protein VNO77_38876 [Canavalia gladiata]|uniref:Uncharacterized protein n=1 Tax=Canavalia gladiata TaxID=3824 RepID=A0AAN9PXQ4_CANGL
MPVHGACFCMNLHGHLLIKGGADVSILNVSISGGISSTKMWGAGQPQRALNQMPHDSDSSISRNGVRAPGRPHSYAKQWCVQTLPLMPIIKPRLAWHLHRLWVHLLHGEDRANYATPLVLDSHQFFFATMGPRHYLVGVGPSFFSSIDVFVFFSQEELSLPPRCRIPEKEEVPQKHLQPKIF